MMESFQGSSWLSGQKNEGRWVAAYELVSGSKIRLLSIYNLT